MPKIGITEYNLLILCLEDVAEFINVIEEAAKKFNRIFGNEHKIRVQTKCWPQDSYSQVEDTSYGSLRKQFINDCDMAVAVFWTSFGTLTDNPKFKMKEDIQTMIDSKKQVFIYFLEKPIIPSKISPDYIKVRKFQEQCKQRGLCFEVDDEKELKFNLIEDLMSFFSKKAEAGKEELSVRNISELSKEQSAWLAEDKNTMIGIFL